MRQHASDDEIEVFTRKIHALKNVAKELSDRVNSQSNEANKLLNPMNQISEKLQRLHRRVSKSNTTYFRGWLYYLVATIVSFLLIFVFFVLF